MKKLIYYGLFLLLLSACQNREDNVSASESTQLSENKAEDSENILELPYNAEYNEQTEELELKHNAGASKLSVPDMITALNLKYPQILLRLTSKKHDTIYVRINDAAYLSQSMGSTGARTYMAEATFALTEITGIKAVNFTFQEGDHASPGTYTRNAFAGYK